MSTAMHLHGSHDPGLVVLSVVIATLASYAALDLASRVAVIEGRSRWPWLATSGMVMGTGIWSMHFVGMLAFRLAVPVGYDPARVLLSLAVAVVASTLGFSIVAWLHVSKRRLLAGGVLLGGAIAGMHYIGMWALLGAAQHYQAGLVLASVVIAFVASTAALALFGRVLAPGSPSHHAFKPAAGTVMGAAIASMHYTAMAAVSFPGAAARLPDAAILPGRELTLAVTLGAIVVALLALFAAASERRMHQAARERDATRRRLLLVQALGRTSAYAAVVGAVMVMLAFGSGVYRRAEADSLRQTVRIADQHHAQLALVQAHRDAAVRTREPAAIRTVEWSLRHAVDICGESAPAVAASHPEVRRRFSAVCATTRSLDSSLAVTLRSPPAVREQMIPALQQGYTQAAQQSEALLRWMDRELANAARTNRLVDATTFVILLGVLFGFTVLMRRSRNFAAAQTHQLLQLASIVEASSDAIVAQALDGTIETWNFGAEQLFGYSEEEIVGQPFTILVPPESQEAAWHDMLAVMAGDAVEQREVERVRKDGTRVHLSITEAPVRDADGKIVRVAAVARDVTERRAAERAQRQAREAAEAANAAKSEFLANMSHEIRTPMNGILGMLDLALDTPLTTSQQEYVETARSSAESLLEIVNDVLDFSRIEAGHFELETVPFALEQGVLEAIRPLGVRAKEKGLAFTIDMAPDVPRHLIGDAGCIRQVLINLVANAVKFTSRGSVRVHLDVAARDGDGVTLHVAVEDTGIGVPRDKQQAIFEMFQQADTSVTREYGGTGLGLAISSRLAALLGGDLWVESEPGVGSTFHFTAHAAVDQDAGARATAQPAPRGITRRRFEPAGGTGRALRVLVAEDHPVNLRLTRAMLEGTGFHVSVVRDGASAVDVTARERFDLVLMDVQMPVMGGLEATRLIRQRERGSGGHLPIIAVTARAMKGDRDTCLEAGMDDYLAKPITAEALLDAIARTGAGTVAEAPAAAAYVPQGAVPADGQEDVLDEPALWRAVEHDPSLRDEVVLLFFTDADARLADMQSALEDCDAAALREAAHAIAGAAASIGAIKATAAARGIERLARAGDLAAAQQAMSGFAVDLARLRARLAEPAGR